MQIIAIDGACRRNGKPDCISAGGVFMCNGSSTSVFSNYEYKSTNQRGELLALLTALDQVYVTRKESIIVTDSEYLFNAMTKEWFVGWDVSGWITASGTPVKNTDIWREIKHAYDKCLSVVEIHFYHIKGHVLPFGRVTADKLLDSDHSGRLLYEAILNKYESSVKKQLCDIAQELSLKNNGFKFEADILRLFVSMNTVADAIATKVVDAANNAFLNNINGGTPQ